MPSFRSSRRVSRALTSILLATLAAAVASAQEWQGWTDESVRLRTRTFDFGAPGGSNENYYDGDFADFDGDFRMDRALISRYGLLWNTGEGFLSPVSTQRIDPVTGQASGPQSLRSYTGYRFGDGYAGNDAVQWADVDGDGDPDSIQGGNGEPFVIQSNRAGRFYETWRASGSALNITTTDVEKDGDVDLAVAHAFCSNRNCTGPVDFKLWINDGTGRFTDEAAARGLPYAPDLVVGVASGDVDADGDFDLVLLDGIRRTVLVMLNDAGRYTETVAPFARPVADIIAFGGGFGQMPHLGDVDDDGDLDLVLVLGGNNDADMPGFEPVGMHPFVSHVVMINDGTGRFAEDPARWNVTGLPRALVGENGKLTDVDYDGDLDIVAFAKAGPDFFQIFLNDGAGYFTFRPDLDPVAWPLPRTSSTGVDLDVSDLDGDGTYDTWIGIAGFPPTTLQNTHRDPTGLRADWPRAARLVATGPSGVTLSWQHPPWAATNRRYRVLRSTAPGTEPRDREVVHDIALSLHEDDSFAAPITRFTTTAALGDPDVVLDGSRNLVTYTDRSAVPGVTYWYSIVHVGTERNASQPTREIAATVPLPDPTAPDVTPPELTILSPTWQEWGTHPRVVVAYDDGQSGVELTSLEVRFDVPLGDGDPASGGAPAGDNVARVGARAGGGGVYVDRLDTAQALPAGLTTLTVRIADRAGNVSERRVTFDVSLVPPQAPVADMTATLRPGTQVVDFDAGSSADADGIVMKWEWSFGDGTTAEGRRVTHRYRDATDHVVTLQVRDDDGAVDETSLTVTVAPAEPDTDGDGLSDRTELDGGTDPDLADTDGDGALDAADCLPSDAIAAVPPAEVTGLRIRGGAAAAMSWDAAAGDPAILVYDVAAGSIASLRSLGPAAVPACLARDAPSTSASDPAAAPAGGAYYLVRAVAGCPRAGSQWGNDTLGRPRGSSATCP